MSYDTHKFVYDGGLLPVPSRRGPSVGSSRMYRCEKCGIIRDEFEAQDLIQALDMCLGVKNEPTKHP